MARSYAQIVTAIWRDADFRALTVAEQHLYLLLSTQPDISAAGVLPLAVVRWAGRAADTKPADIVRALDGLARRRYVVYDRDTEEVLVRSFIRWDRGYSNLKRQPAIRDAVDQVESPAILSALAAEMIRVDMPVKFRGRAGGDPGAEDHQDHQDQAVDHPKDHQDQTDQINTDVPTLDQNRDDPAFSQVDSLSDAYPVDDDSYGHTDAAEERRVPQQATHNPQPATLGSKPLITATRRPDQLEIIPGTDPRAALDALHVASVKRSSRDRQFTDFWDAYPRKVGKIKARKAWDAAVRNNADPAAIAAGAVAFAANRAAWRTEIDKIPHPTTWLNAGRWDDHLDPPPSAALTARGGFDDRAAGFDQMRDRLRHDDGAVALIRQTAPQLTAGDHRD